MEAVIVIIIIFELLFNVGLVAAVEDCDGSFLSCFIPIKMYEATEMNIVGCWICSLIMFLVFPFVGIPCVIYALFHIGRKKRWY